MTDERIDVCSSRSGLDVDRPRYRDRRSSDRLRAVSRDFDVMNPNIVFSATAMVSFFFCFLSNCVTPPLVGKICARAYVQCAFASVVDVTRPR